MACYRVLGRFRNDEFLKQDALVDVSFEQFEDAIYFVWTHDPLGALWIQCPGKRWFHPDTGQWR